MIEQMARDAGMEPGGRGARARWRPCPFYLGDRAGRLRSTEHGCDHDGRRSATVAIDGDRFYCHGCMQGGGPKTFARLVGGEVPGDYVPAPPAPKVDEAGEVDVDAAWRELHAVPTAWAVSVRRTLMRRGWSEEMARRVQGHPDLAGRVERGQHARNALVRLLPPRFDLLVALRDPRGTVRDVARRWGCDGEAPERKSMRLRTQHAGRFADALMLGVLADVVEAARQGRPVIVVEGEMNFAACAALAGDRAAVVGIPGIGSAPAVCEVLAGALEAVQGCPVVWAVPDIGDNPHRRDHELYKGERVLLDAVVAHLLPVARVLWSPPLVDRLLARRIAPRVVERDPWTRTAEIPLEVRRPQCDAEDLLRSADPSVAWDALCDGLPVVCDGHEEDWRRADDYELARQVHRLPLMTVIEACHWGEDKDDALTRFRAVVPEHRIADLVIEWFEAHGGEFFHDGAKPLCLWRQALYQVDGPLWSGVLGELGRLNPSVREGRAVFEAMVQRCHRHRRPAQLAPAFWAGPAEIRVHLHRAERDAVLSIRAGRCDIVQNGAETDGGERVVQLADLGGCDAIDWRSGVTPAEGARALYDHVARWWAVQPVDRLMGAAWLLTSWYRQQVRHRPILWAEGESGSGKTSTAELLVALLYGERGRVVANPTKRSLYALGGMPVIVLDNAENKGQGTIEDFLVNGATGRQMRTRGTMSGGVEGQIVEAMVCVTAIEPPRLPEVNNRRLVMSHDAAFRDPAYRTGVIGELASVHRPLVLSGMVALWSECILPRMGEVGPLATTVPSDHSIARQAETIALMALIAECLGALDPRWVAAPAVDVIQVWLKEQGERQSAATLGGSPLELAMERLMLEFNFVTARGFDGMWQAAVESDVFACQPVYEAETWNGETRGPLTDNKDDAKTVKRHGRDWPRVVGVIGSATDLYQDMVEAMRRRGLHTAFVEQIASAGSLAARFTSLRETWARLPMASGARPRPYLYVPARFADAVIEHRRRSQDAL